MSMSKNDRVTELEIQLAHQQRLCEATQPGRNRTQLSKILRLERVIVRLEDQIKAVRELRKEGFGPPAWKNRRIIKESALQPASR